MTFEEWPTPIVFTDYQYGRPIYAGRAVSELSDTRNPVRDAFRFKLPSRRQGDQGGGRSRDGRAHVPSAASVKYSSVLRRRNRLRVVSIRPVRTSFPISVESAARSTFR